MSSRIYTFGLGNAEGGSDMKQILGGKGANLAQMCKNGLPVPYGFTIPTIECGNFYSNNKAIPRDLISKVHDGIKFIENGLGKQFGNENNPLLVSVRSGAAMSMPGMMDTILNLGLNDKTVDGLAKISNNKRFAYDSYRRFIQMYSDVVLGIDHYLFDDIIESRKLSLGVVNDSDLSADVIIDIVAEFKKVVVSSGLGEFPQDVNQQLLGAVEAVFKSWDSERAIYYRNMTGISHEIYTAVTVQAMVFGNLNNDSGTGVAFTRNPSTGEKYIYGEFLLNAQGEDVVAGIRTPFPINKESIVGKKDNDTYTLEEKMPQVYEQFKDIAQKLELHYKDMQDIEFTIENKKLFILQTRSGKRTAKAAVKIAVQMVESGLISRNDAILRVDPSSLDALLHRTINPSSKDVVIEKGLPASPGAACGCVAFSQAKVKENHGLGIPSILVRLETSPEDIEGMNLSAGILTARGGMTSHAAVVARGMGKTCITGAKGISIDYKKLQFITKQGITVKEGDTITIDGTSGLMYLGEIQSLDPEMFTEFKTLLDWAREVKTLQVRTNAETELDSSVAIKFGAEGIGLCRTEHMFFDKKRILTVRQMILADTKEDRKAALEILLPYQTQDFIKIFQIMKGLPVNIRLLDPPLHEFLPQKTSEIIELAETLKVSQDQIHKRIHDLHEQNPMLGHRGCRLGITFPEIYEMQIEAIFSAAYDVMLRSEAPIIEIMIPFVISSQELSFFKLMTDNIAQTFVTKYSKPIKYLLGTMIETPRAALLATDIAKVADYFSFGTNDLTQMTLALSRDDSGNFISDYIKNKIFEFDPFQKLDVQGVGQLIRIASTSGRSIKSNLKLGICGEHGGDPSSIQFCQDVGLDYVSCSPYRVPIAIIAAAQAKIKTGINRHLP